MSEFSFHPEAEIDLNEIWDFIAEDSIDAADRVRDKIFAAIQSLARTPHQGHRRGDLTSRPLRFWRVYDYLIVYAPDERPLLVVAILHGRRNPRILAGMLRDRE
jgi:plasmid stabilization system protein ParE